MSEHKALRGRTPLFKTMFGSRLYGTNTPTSDVDWKEVFLPAIDQLLIGRKPTNVVVSTGGDHVRNTKDDIDNEYIPIQVFANDFIGGQTYAIELAYSVLASRKTAGQKVYDNEFIYFVWELTETFLTSNIKAMVGYAMNQAQIYGIKGTRLASVRAFSEYLDDILNTNQHSPTAKLEVLDDWIKANETKYLFKTDYAISDTEKRPALSLLEKVYPYQITLAEAHERTKTLISKYGSRAHDAETAKGMDWKATAHAVRITKQAIRILNDGCLDFPFQDREVEFLLSIKNGERSVEEVQGILEALFVELDEAKEKTKLPAKDVAMEEAFERWLQKWMLRFYGIEPA